MSVLPFLDIVSFSAEHPQHRVKNIVSGSSGKWTCPQVFAEKSIEVEVSIPPAYIEGIDVGNYGSASIEVQVNKSGNPISKRETLVLNTVLMTRLDWVRGVNKETMKFIGKENFCHPASTQWWDRVRIVCHQPFSTSNFELFGLSKIVVRGRRLSDVKQRDGHICNESAKNDMSEGAQLLLSKIDKQLPTPKLSTLSASVKAIETSRFSTSGDGKITSPVSRSGKMLDKGGTSGSQNGNASSGKGSRKRSHVLEDDFFSIKPDTSFRNNVALFDTPKAKSPSGCSFRPVKVESVCDGQTPESFRPKFNFKAVIGSGEIDLSNASTFKHLSHEHLTSKGILVQAKTYKKPKTLPLEGGDFVTTSSGQTVHFYKQGPKVYMEISGKVYRPKVAVEHLSGIFKGYNSEDLQLEEFERLNVPELNCPMCRKSFENEDRLVEHCEDCNGPGEPTIEKEQCPICLKYFSATVINGHAEECAQSNFG